jgi:hypothetical protein
MVVILHMIISNIACRLEFLVEFPFSSKYLEVLSSLPSYRMQENKKLKKEIERECELI